MRQSSVEAKRREYGPAPLPRGETDAGHKFAPIRKDMIQYIVATNRQCAEYSVKIEAITNLLTRMVNRLHNNEKALTFSIDRSEFIDLISLANIGRLYLLFMAKESCDIMNDVRGK